MLNPTGEEPIQPWKPTQCECGFYLAPGDSSFFFFLLGVGLSMLIRCQGSYPGCHIRKAGHGLEELGLFVVLGKDFCLLILLGKSLFSFGRARNIQAGLAPEGLMG